MFQLLCRNDIRKEKEEEKEGGKKRRREKKKIDYRTPVLPLLNVI